MAARHEILAQSERNRLWIHAGGDGAGAMVDVLCTAAGA
jgi:hypothetical protein